MVLWYSLDFPKAIGNHLHNFPSLGKFFTLNLIGIFGMKRAGKGGIHFLKLKKGGGKFSLRKFILCYILLTSVKKVSRYGDGSSLISTYFPKFSSLQLRQTSWRSSQTPQWMSYPRTFRNDSRKLQLILLLGTARNTVCKWYFQIDYVDGRARTERITDSSSTTISTSHPSVNSNGLITEVTIQPHQQSHEGTFVDSSDGGSGSSPPPPPHPPRMPSSQLHNYHGHMHLRHGHHRLHHLHSHHIHSSIPPGRPPSGSGGDSSGYHSSGGNPPKTNLRSSRSSDSSSAYRYVNQSSSRIIFTNFYVFCNFCNFLREIAVQQCKT